MALNWHEQSWFLEQARLVLATPQVRFEFQDMARQMCEELDRLEEAEAKIEELEETLAEEEKSNEALEETVDRLEEENAELERKLHDAEHTAENSRSGDGVGQAPEQSGGSNSGGSHS